MGMRNNFNNFRNDQTYPVSPLPSKANMTGNITP